MTKFFVTLFAMALNCYISLANTNNSDTVSSSTIYKAVGLTGAYYAASMYVLGKTWYKDKDVVPFHFYNDNAGYNQVDKLGHVFGSYVYSYAGYNIMKNIGLSRNESLIFGGSLGLILQTPIEIMDGIHQGYGFSWGDMIANSLGSAIVISQELLFDEQIVKYKFSYWESEYSTKANGMLGTNHINRILKDYNGQTYWISIPIKSIYNNEIIPDYLNIAFGYGANGMYGEFANEKSYKGIELPEAKRYRQFLLSLDIDWTKIKTDSDLLNTILQGMVFIKLPFPALEYNTKNEVKLHWLFY